jgi:SET domain-containing protein 6
LKEQLPELDSLDEWMSLILVMLYENQQAASPWRPYFGTSLSFGCFNSDILPEQFDTPMFWNETELKELAGTEVVSRIGKQKSEEQYTQLLLPIITANPNLFDPSKCDADAFHRMGSLVLAYSFGNSDSSDDESESGHTEISMVPLADMLNANPQLNNVSHPIFGS